MAASSSHSPTAPSSCLQVMRRATVERWACTVLHSPAHAGERLIAPADALAEAGGSGVYAVSVATGHGRAIAQFQGLTRKVGGTVLRETTND